MVSGDIENSCPSVSAEDWFQEPPWIPKSTDAQVSYEMVQFKEYSPPSLWAITKSKDTDTERWADCI